MRTKIRLSRGAWLLAGIAGIWIPMAQSGEQPSLLELGFEQLMDMEVSTAARREQPLSHTPAAVSVITAEDIRRSGAASLPEALRLAPGVAVAQISPSKWSVSIRGFSGRFANKLLVLIDGRSVYTPAFSGVYWEIHDLPLEEVERIEVIRGPGATLWGANAVNGVINIITRHSSSTHGAVADLRGGNRQQSGGLRVGGSLADQADLRVHAEIERQDGFDSVFEGELDNDFDRQQIGFRSDWSYRGTNQFTLQGDLIRLDQGQVLTVPDLNAPPGFSTRVDDRVDVDAGNLLARWERSLSVDSEIQVQVYWDYYQREEFTREERVSTLDLDMQHRVSAYDTHDIIWGLGYRYIDDTAESNPQVISGFRESRALNMFSGFIQDEMELMNDELWLTLGTKVEHNDLTGVEWQPNIRLLWAPDTEQSLWGSIARAVRTPSYGERDYRVSTDVVAPFSGLNPSPLPVVLAVDGNAGFDSESVVAYEVGYRRRFSERLTLDIAAFYNDYQDLRATRWGLPEFRFSHLVQALPFWNDMEGTVYGGEVAVDWRPAPRWRVQPILSVVQSELRLKAENNLPDSEGLLSSGEEGHPQLQLSLRAGWSPRNDLDLDLWLRHVSETRGLGRTSSFQFRRISDYTTLDLRAAWRPSRGLELALVGKNLLDASHQEGEEESYPTPSEIPRSVLATLRYQF